MQVVTNVTTTEIDLSWQDNAGDLAQGYHIIRAINHGAFVLVATLPPTSRGSQHLHLVRHQPHSRHVLRVPHHGLQRVRQQRLRRPQRHHDHHCATALTAQASNAVVNLSWTAPAGAASYNIYRGSAAGLEGSTPLATGVTTTTFADQAVTNGASYYYTVTAVNGNLAPLPSESVASPEVLATPSPTQLSIGSATGTEGSLAGAVQDYFHTSGNQIVDVFGNDVKIAGVNWFGMEGASFAPQGLDVRTYQSMIDQMKQLGYNTIRIPYSNQIFDAASTPLFINYTLNPDLVGLNPLGILDKIVNYAGQDGMRIILSDHDTTTAGPDASGLWYTAAYPQTTWINDWTLLAQRYANNPTVIGADLFNEPHGQATWGTGNAATDWRLAAQNAGNAILAANPNWLIIVDGIQTTSAGSDWWGGNLSAAGQFPVALNTPGRLVYSPHDYTPDVAPQTWFTAANYPNNLPSVWTQNWGYLFINNIAPVYLGEFGTTLATQVDQQWIGQLTNYLQGNMNTNGTNVLHPGQQGISWTYWAWNPTSADVGGLLQSDWTTPVAAKVAALQPIEFAFPNSTNQSSPGTPLTFTVTLSAASTTPVTVAYSTVDGTAKAGLDYTATSGTLTFPANVTSETITVPVLSDAALTSSETLSVLLSLPSGATIAQSKGAGTINPAVVVPPPSISIGSATGTEGFQSTVGTPLTFTVTLSAASTTPVTVAYSTADGTATAGLDYTATSGTLTFAPGKRTLPITVPVLSDAALTSSKTLSVVLSLPSGATILQGTGAGTINPAVVPQLSIGSASGIEGRPAGAVLDYFHTSGNQIVDAFGNDVKIAGLNWFGLEQSTFTPQGMDVRSYQAMMDQMKQLGYNTIRIPYSNQIFDAGKSPLFINYTLNPDLVGLNPLGILDKIVSYAGHDGLRIILDDHATTTTGPNATGLWYTTAYPQTTWINDWTLLAQRYANNPTVIGADLFNEPHGQATWGSGNAATDWRLASQNAGNAILAANPNWLIFVEGIQTTSQGSDWWGGNLAAAAQFPVVLKTPGRLVYSPHDYTPDVAAQSWFTASNYPNNLPAVWTKFWGYLFINNIAPLYLGEFGTTLATQVDQQWMGKLTNYLQGNMNTNGTSVLLPGQQGASWGYWAWNPTSGDVGGLLQNDWTTPVAAKVAALQPIEYTLPSGTSQSNPGAPLTFTVTLSAVSPTPVTVAYSTVDGTAKAGLDYTATSGTLTFPANVTSETITVPVLSDAALTSSRTLSVMLSAPSGATILQGTGAGTINPTVVVPLPTISIGSVSGTEGHQTTAGTPLKFTVTLSAASTTPVTVAYSTVDGTAKAGLDYTATSGTLTFAPGQRSLTVAVPVLSDAALTSSRTMSVVLSAPSGATIFQGTGAGIINPAVIGPLPSISISSATGTEGRQITAGTPLTFTVTLSAASTTPVTVAYSTLNGTAMAGIDYTTTKGTLTFAPGQRSLTITVPVLSDAALTSSRTLSMVLSAPSGATIAKGTGAGTINPAVGTISAKVATAVTANFGNAFNESVTITNTGTQPISNWTLEFDLPFVIQTIWSSTIVSHTGNHYVLHPVSYNQTINPGASITIGFTASGSALIQPANFKLDGFAI